ncbi:MAG: hydrolase [Labilithrix sp.]|nr:hydrolase [Labilithrix sp.]
MSTGTWTVAAVLCVTGVLAAACGSRGAATQPEVPGAAGAEPGGPDPRGASDGGDAVTLPDGAVAAPPLVKCSREAEALPAPASLLDAFTAEMKSLTGGAARAARVDQLVADVVAQGGTPLEDRLTGRVVFLARGAPPSGPWAITTSLVAFDAAKATPLLAVADTDLWIAEATIPRGASFEYRLLSGAMVVEDANARSLVWDGVPVIQAEDEFKRGSMNAVGHAMDWPKDRGRVVRHGRVHATKLGSDRDVFVYLPARYDDGTCATKLPSVVFQDGREALTNGDFAHAADLLYAARPELAAILVFAANAGTLELRNDEYSFGYGGSKASEYVDFVATDLWPKISAGYRMCTKPSSRGISGASLGGLVATFAAFERPNDWGWVGAQSASFFWKDNELIGRVQSSPKVPARFYLDSGEDNAEYVDLMAGAMADKAYDYVRIKEPGAQHRWSYWHGRFAGMLAHFRDGKTDCD